MDTGRDKTLWYAIDKSGNSGSIGGTVTSGSTPLSGARATVYLRSGTQWQNVAGANTDALGRYLVNNLTPGLYRVGLRKTGYATRFYQNATIIRNGADVTVAAGATTRNINGNLPLAQTGQSFAATVDWRLLATVRDATTGAPIHDATVTLYQIPGWQPQSTPADETEGVCLLGSVTRAESQLPPSELGEWVEPPGEEEILTPIALTPALNPQSSDGEGRLGWTMSAGCWYVTVDAPGYQSLTSPVVGILDIPVTLDLPLIPQASFIYQLYLPLNAR